jgi:hypothetical protein
VSAKRPHIEQAYRPSDELGDILREPAAAAFLDKTPSALRTARCRGSASCPPYFKRGASIFYSKTVLRRWLAEGAVGPTTSPLLPRPKSRAGDL